MKSQVKDNKFLGLYLHVPFCATPCEYCAFYKERPTKELINLYVDTVVKEILMIEDERCFNTIYFGGGTPGILQPQHFEKIVNAIHQVSNYIPDEWTVELAPVTVKKSLLHSLKIIGVNRISVGIQSFLPKTLAALGRKQTPEQSFMAFQLLRDAGFVNIGLDLIFSAPNQTESEILYDLETAVNLSPEHISTYCLTYEQNTILNKKYTNGSDETLDSKYYQLVCEFLKSNKYVQYEISNFSRYGQFASIHNMNTWKMQEWIGVGPSASSQYKNRRYTNVNSLLQWINGINSKRFNRYDEMDLSKADIELDEILFGIRMNAGVNIKNNIHIANITNLLHELQCNGLIKFDNYNLSLTPKGRLLCDAIENEIFCAASS